jgi:hypothetical protein
MFVGDGAGKRAGSASLHAGCVVHLRRVHSKPRTGCGLPDVSPQHHISGLPECIVALQRKNGVGPFLIAGPASEARVITDL